MASTVCIHWGAPYNRDFRTQQMKRSAPHGANASFSPICLIAKM